MQNYHGCSFSIYGALKVLILQGVCAVLADTNEAMVFKVGSSLSLTVKSQNESVSLVEWNFNKIRFADYFPDHTYTFEESQFSGRLKALHGIIGITIQDLQPQDAGTFSIIEVGPHGQSTTQNIKVHIQRPITAVQIDQPQIWKVSTNSCVVNVKCAVHGAESVSYLWGGYINASGAQLQFSLPPADRAIILNCTAANNISSSSATVTLTCSTNAETTMSELKLVSSLVAAFPYLLVTIILGVKCKRAHGHNNRQDALAVIEE
ncbi:uncharacterized protein LOC128520395 [Clarias gariepinus]|uniref:uncharacterized protein LOC128520395 n=1 Tax=Clarias gariepinus TaxID=13013 RepID=UPI00234E1426|nr:uncharacterized protein LOC128520395 [Clarias gariepinus]